MKCLSKFKRNHILFLVCFSPCFALYVAFCGVQRKSSLLWEKLYFEGQHMDAV